jgi:hypothetical protein
MNIPNTLSRQTLASLAPDDTHCVRVILKKVANNAPYLVRGRTRKYLFERNPEVKAHALDIPVSVWMQGANESRGYRPGISIPEDLKPTMQMPYVIHVVERKAARQASAASDAPAEQAEAPDEIPEESPSQARARKMREAKAAKKLESQKA